MAELDSTELQQESDVLSRLQGYMQQEPEPTEEEQEEDAPHVPSPPAREGEDAEEEEKPQKGDEITIDPDAEIFEFTVKAEGGKDETVRMSLSQMQAGVMMQQDYQRKTAELARARDNLQQEMEEIVAPERETYMRNIEAMQQAVYALGHAELNGIDWEALAAQDPAKYVQLAAKAQRVQQTVGQMQEMMNAARARSWQAQVDHSRRALNDPINGN